MNYTILTSFNEKGLNSYGQRMIDSFEAMWPKEVGLVVYAENCRPRVTRPNTTVIDLLSISPDLRDFISRHKNNPLAHGQAGPPGVFDPQKQFRWDAVRFSYKVFSVQHAISTLNNWVIWLDADTTTHSPITMDVLSTVCPDTAMISYLGRGDKYHSECGWVGYNLSHPYCREFVNDFVGMYTQDSIFQLPEWHDSFVWDQVRKRKVQSLFHNLNVNWQDKGLSGHPFINSVLGRYMDHAKGDRKQQGHSKSTDIKAHNDIPYWNNIRANNVSKI